MTYEYMIKEITSKLSKNSSRKEAVKHFNSLGLEGWENYSVTYNSHTERCISFWRRKVEKEQTDPLDNIMGNMGSNVENIFKGL